MRRFLYIIILLLTAVQFRLEAQEFVPVKPQFKSPHNAFAAVPYKKGWVYVTDENYLSFASYVNQQDQPLFRIVFSDSLFTKQKELEGLMKDHVNYGPLVFYASEKKAVVTRNLASVAGKKAKLGLFFYSEDRGKWEMEGAFAYNNEDYSCGHAAINEKGDTLVFASDMPGGAGGTDLYMTVKQNGVWLPAVNLKPLNTAANEMYPFLHPGGQLFFSSDRTGGKGQMDIYRTQTGYPYTVIQPLDSAINSSADDFAFTCNKDQRRGNFSSNRSGYDQLYSFHQWVPEFVDCIPWEETILCYDFYEEASLNIDTLPLVYEWDFGDGFKEKKLASDHCYKAPGTYTIQLNILDTVIHKLYMNAATYDLEIKEPVQPAIDYKFKGRDSLLLTAAQGTWTDFSVGKMYWNTGGIVTEGYTCMATMQGADTKEVLLVLRSADYRKAQCFQRKISIAEKPKAAAPKPVTEEKQVSEKDEEIFRLILNESPERTAIDKEHFSELYTKVDEFYFPEDSMYRYTYGEAKGPLELKPAYDEAHKAGFGEASVWNVSERIENTSEYEISQLTLSELSEGMLNSVIGKTFELPLVYFDYASAELKPECLPPLDSLAKYMNKHRDFTVEITAHTDSQGPDDFNLTLSEERATAVFRYLGEKGVPLTIMHRKGYGEIHPKYPNTTQENMAKNRRVEFRILK